MIEEERERERGEREIGGGCLREERQVFHEMGASGYLLCILIVFFFALLNACDSNFGFE